MRLTHAFFQYVVFCSLQKKVSLARAQICISYTATAEAAASVVLLGTLKTRDWKMQDWKTWDQIAWVEITGLENGGPVLQGWKTRDWKTREHNLYGQPDVT